MHNVTFLRSCVQRQTTKRLGVASVLLEKDGDVQSSDQQSWVFDGGRLEEEAIYQGHWRVVIVLNQNIGWMLDTLEYAIVVHLLDACIILLYV